MLYTKAAFTELLVISWLYVRTQMTEWLSPELPLVKTQDNEPMWEQREIIQRIRHKQAGV